MYSKIIEMKTIKGNDIMGIVNNKIVTEMKSLAEDGNKWSIFCDEIKETTGIQLSVIISHEQKSIWIVEVSE